MSVMISRDPFARTELHREVTLHCTPCDWCGQYRQHHMATDAVELFRYGTKTDGGKMYWHKGLFCSKGCHDAHHS